MEDDDQDSEGEEMREVVETLEWEEEVCEKIRGVSVFCSPPPRRLQWIAINCQRNQL